MTLPPPSPAQVRAQPLRFAPEWGPEGDEVVAGFVDSSDALSRAAAEVAALSTKSFAARHLLLHAAAGPALRYDALVDHLRAHDIGDRGLGRGLPKLNLLETIRLAKVMGLQGLDPEDEVLAARLLALVHKRWGLISFAEVHQKLYAQLLFAAGAHDRLAQLLPRMRLRPASRYPLQADVLNPHVSKVAKGEAAWLAAIAKIFAGTGLETITFGTEGATVFDRMRCEGSLEEVDGPLITVMMSSWRPDASLLTSVRSVLAQTWRNIELLVVDDASPPEYDAVLDQVAALDPARVRIVKQPVNGGTYLARNTALEQARGEFISGQDADDWSHPRRLELQVRPLLKNRHVRATRSRSLRVNDDFLFNQPGYDPILFIAPFLMTRREDVRRYCGYYDRARKAADNEFLWRLVADSEGTLVDIDIPLACQRVGHGSLSRAEFSANWQHAARTIYQASYRNWHGHLLRDGADRRLAAEEPVRPFPAPRRFVDGVPGTALPRNSYDVVLAGDWVTRGAAPRVMLDQVRSLRSRGMRVGVLPLTTMLPPSPRRLPFAADLLDAIAAGDADWVLADQAAQVGLLLVSGPSVLQFPSSTPTDIGVGRVAVLADRAPTGDGGRRYTVPVVDRSVADLFGVAATWVPLGPGVRSALAPLVDADRLWDVDAPRIVAVDSWRVLRRPHLGRPPVVGCMTLESVDTWPARAADLLATYPSPGAGLPLDVRFRRVITTASGLLTYDGLPSEWTSYTEQDIGVRPFLAQLDFYVVGAQEPVTPETHRSALEALASGAVAILPERFRDSFGDGALYAGPAEIGATVAQLWGDPDAYARQSARGVEVAAERYPASAFATLVSDLLAGADSSSLRTAAT